MKIGNTNLIEIEDRIFAKLESENPAGSTKDRVAFQIIQDALNQNKIKTGATIVEATSGNTGIGLAAVAKDMGFECKIFMPENMSKQRIALIESYGAECILTPAKDGMQGAIDEAEKFVSNHSNSFVADQFNNPSNWKAHYISTGPEIYNQMQEKIDVFTAGIGTGGTITGIGKFLKEKIPDVKIIGVEPKNCATISNGSSGPHAIQGIGAGFIPKVLDTKIIDEIITISDEEALLNYKFLNENKKVSAGISSGAAFCAAKKYKRENLDLSRIVVLFPDGSDRYE